MSLNPPSCKGRKRWIAFFHHAKGALFVDEGAKKALRENGKSLLPPGVACCQGDFAAGDVVRICDLNGTEFARGICDFDSAAGQGPPGQGSPGASRQSRHFIMKKKSAMAELLEVMAKLRSPEGCPWDREQNHQTLALSRRRRSL